VESRSPQDTDIYGAPPMRYPNDVKRPSLPNGMYVPKLPSLPAPKAGESFHCYWVRNGSANDESANGSPTGSPNESQDNVENNVENNAETNFSTYVHTPENYGQRYLYFTVKYDGVRIVRSEAQRSILTGDLSKGFRYVEGNLNRLVLKSLLLIII
jgi:hypothetical protein